MCIIILVIIIGRERARLPIAYCLLPKMAYFLVPKMAYCIFPVCRR